MDSLDKRFPVGKIYRTSLKIDGPSVRAFAEFSGDHNPIHMNSEDARAYGYARQVAHGCILIAALSRMIGTEIPGGGAMWLSQSVEWSQPVYIDDEVEMTVTVEKVSAASSILILDVVACNQKGQVVMKVKTNVKVGEKLVRQKPRDEKLTRVALVTGGSRGIGAAIIERLAASGIRTAIHYRQSRSDAQKIADQVCSSGGMAEIFQADLNHPEETSSMVQQVIQSFGSIDVVIHGASPSMQIAKTLELNYDEVEKFLKIYLGGTMVLVSKAAPLMMERKFGRFIFLGTSAMFGTPPSGMTAYVMAKEALWGLVKCLATELGPSGITSNMVSPGMTITDFTAEIPVRIKEFEARKSPMRRLAQVEDTAELVAFLADEASSYINGVNLPVTGGPV
jgi:3-oxoacyl-[acyl-carrier protein] reductase